MPRRLPARPSSVLTAVLLLALPVPAATAQDALPITEPQRTDAVDYATEIQPVLQRHCVACHREQQAEGGLVLDTLAALHRGGDSGPGVVAKQPDDSLLLTRARGLGDGLMPPEDNSLGAEPLTAEQLGLLKLWIEQGAEGTDAAMVKPIRWQPIPQSVRSTYALAVSPDGRLAAFNRANRVLIVDLETQAEVARLVDPGMDGAADVDMIQAIAFSPDGQRIATGGFRTVRLWRNAPLEQPMPPFARAHGLLATNTAPSQAARSQAAWVNAIGDIEVWDLDDGRHMHTLAGHADRITALQWGESHNRLYVGDQAGRIRIWKPADGGLLVDAPTGTAVAQLAVSADGVWIAKRTPQGTVELYQLQQGEQGTAPEVRRVQASLGEVSDATAIALVSKPALTAVVASRTRGVVLIDPAANQVQGSLDHGGEVTSLAVSPDETRLASGGQDGKTRVWTLADKQPLVTLEGTPEQQRLLVQTQRDIESSKQRLAGLAEQTKELTERLGKEDEVLAKATETHQVARETLATSQEKQREATAVVQRVEAVLAAAMAAESKDETAIADATKQVESAKADAKAADEAAAKAAAEATTSEQALQTATAAQQRATGALAAHQQIVDAAQQRAEGLTRQLAEVQALGGGPVHEVRAIVWDADAQRVATSHADGSLRIYRVADAHALRAHRQQPCLSPLGLAFVGSHVVRFATAREAATVPSQSQWRWERTIGSVDDPQTIPDRVTALRFHRDGAALAVGSGQPSQSGQVKIFAWQTAQVVKDFGDLHQDTVLSLAFSPDGRTLASAAADRMIHLLDVSNGATQRRLEGHTHHVLGQAWQADGQTLASAGADQTLRIWNAQSGETSRSIGGFGKEVTAVVYLPGSTQMVAASGDGQVRIADASNGKTIRTLDANGDFLYCVAVTADGKHVLAGGESGVLRMWNVADGKSVAKWE